MAKITVLGGTGYAGGHIVAAAKRRGHAVAVYSRSAPAIATPGVTYLQASVLDKAVLDRVFDAADVVISALAPRGELTGKMLQVIKELEARSASSGKRLGVVGGAASLLLAPEGPKVFDLPAFPEEYKAEATEMQDVLTFLQSHGARSDWFYLSPPGGFGASPRGGELTGKYRVGGDVLLVGADGQSTISGPDFGDALIAEVESHTHVRQRFTVGY